MDTTTIIQLIGLVFSGASTASTVFGLTAKSTPPKNFKQPLINEIRLNVALLDDFFKAKPKKKAREDLNGVASKLKTESYDKLLSEYTDLKWTFGKKKTGFKHEPLYESIHNFYYKIEELQKLIDSPQIRPYARLKNICTRGHDILDTINKKKNKKRYKNNHITKA